MKYGDKIAAAVIVGALLLGGWLWSGCTAAQGMAVLSAAQLAAKLGCEHLCPHVTGDESEEP